MNEIETYKLLPKIMLGSVVIGLLSWIPYIIKRLVKKEKVFTKPEPEDSRVTKGKCIFAIILFSAFAFMSIAFGLYLTAGIFFLLIVFSFIVLKYYGEKSK